MKTPSHKKPGEPCGDPTISTKRFSTRGKYKIASRTEIHITQEFQCEVDGGSWGVLVPNEVKEHNLYSLQASYPTLIVLRRR